MNTFMAFPDLQKSMWALDDRRLGKQRLEAIQCLRSNQFPPTGWSKHPASIMWRGYTEFLEIYKDCCIAEWMSRGFRNTMPLTSGKVFLDPGIGGGYAWYLKDISSVEKPYWFGFDEFHRCHGESLVCKVTEDWVRWTFVLAEATKSGTCLSKRQKFELDKVTEAYTHYNEDCLFYHWPSMFKCFGQGVPEKGYMWPRREGDKVYWRKGWGKSLADWGVTDLNCVKIQ